jgi:hypothetical protein
MWPVKKNLLAAGAGTIPVMAGHYLAMAVHEWAHAITAGLLGGRVLAIQPWAFLGPTHTLTSGLKNSRLSIALVSPVLCDSTLAAVVLLLVPWTKLPARLAALLALFLLPFVADCWQWAFEPLLRSVESDPVLFVVLSGWDDFVVALLGQLVLWGGVWFWLRRTRFLRQYHNAMAGPGDEILPV